MYHEDGCNYWFFSTIPIHPAWISKNNKSPVSEVGYVSPPMVGRYTKSIKKSSLKLSFLISSILLILNAFRLIWQFHNLWFFGLWFFGSILSDGDFHIDGGWWWWLFTKVNLCPSWMCLMANTLGIPGESWPTETRPENFGLDLRSSQKKKKQEKIGKFGALKQWKQLDFYGFWRLVVFKMILSSYNFIHLLASSHHILLISGEECLHRLLFCCSVRHLCCCPVNCWPAGGEDTRHVDGVKHPLKIKGVCDRTHDPKQKCEGKKLWQVNLFIYFLKRWCVFLQCEQTPPYTHTFAKAIVWLKYLVNLLKLTSNLTSINFRIAMIFSHLMHLFENDVWYWNLLRSIREQPLKNHSNKSIKSDSNQFHPCFIIQIKSHQII